MTNFSHAFAGRQVGIREIEEKIWPVRSPHSGLGLFDDETGGVECADNPFEAEM